MTGKELKELRKKLDLTQHEMGQKLAISAGAVAHLESGRNTMGPQTAALLKIVIDNS